MSAVGNANAAAARTAASFSPTSAPPSASRAARSDRRTHSAVVIRCCAREPLDLAQLVIPGIQRPLRALGPQADRLDQLRHRPRRLHAARPRVLQREAQRGQRRGQQRRREPQPLVELRRRGPDERPGDPRPAAASAAQLPHHPALLAGRADDAPRRRARPHPERQQQRLLPGQRHLVDPVDPRRGRPEAPRLHAVAREAAPGAPGLPTPPVLRRQRRPRRRERAR